MACTAHLDPPIPAQVVLQKVLQERSKWYYTWRPKWHCKWHSQWHSKWDPKRYSKWYLGQCEHTASNYTQFLKSYYMCAWVVACFLPSIMLGQCEHTA